MRGCDLRWGNSVHQHLLNFTRYNNLVHQHKLKPIYEPTWYINKNSSQSMNQLGASPFTQSHRWDNSGHQHLLNLIDGTTPSSAPTQSYRWDNSVHNLIATNIKYSLNRTKSQKLYYYLLQKTQKSG